MKCKIFSARNRPALEAAVNAWLETYEVSPASMRFNYSEIVVDLGESYKVEYTLVLFYVPMLAI